MVRNKSATVMLGIETCFISAEEQPPQLFTFDNVNQISRLSGPQQPCAPEGPQQLLLPHTLRNSPSPLLRTNISPESIFLELPLTQKQPSVLPKVNPTSRVNGIKLRR